jgi:3-oxoacyl-[acyl-carrier-protein] synthase-3
LKLLEAVFGPDNVMTGTFASTGNMIAAGIPYSLYEAIEQGRIQRGDEVLLIGSGAGLSLAALKFTY